MNFFICHIFFICLFAGDVHSRTEQVKALTTKIKCLESSDLNKSTALESTQQQLATLSEKNSHTAMHLHELEVSQPLCCWWLIWLIQNGEKKMTETLAHGFSSKSTQQELSNEYQHEMFKMFFKNLCILVLWTKVALELERLTHSFLQLNLTLQKNDNNE